jgi:hypothetical protein
VSAEKMIYQYLKNSRGARKGVMVAVGNDTHWALGVSVANTSAGDVFDAGLGIKMAHGRALHALELWQEHVEDAAKMKKALEEISEAGVQDQKVPVLAVNIMIPIGVCGRVHEFAERCKLYFKDKTSAASYYADNVKDLQKEVAQLTMLFEAEENKYQQNPTPPSLRGQQAEMQAEMKELAESLELIKAKELIVKNMKNRVTRVQKP